MFINENAESEPYWGALQSIPLTGAKFSRLKAGFQSVPVRVDFLMLVRQSSSHAKRKSGRSGGSGLFPAIKTALVDVCHRKKVWHRMILKSYGELGLGRPRKDATRTNMLGQNSNSRIQRYFHRTTHLRPAAPRRSI